MNTRLNTSIAIFACAVTAVLADPPTPDPLRSQLQSHLRIDVDKETDTIHFINTNNDPDILTKTYVLKHADPYELRPYLREAVGAERITGGTSRVECLKYNDGTGVLIVSAEDYRFEKKPGKMSIGEIIEALDVPDVTSEEDFSTFVYFPKYWDSDSLLQIVSNVGASVANDLAELESGADAFTSDTGLNAILFYVAPYSKKHIEHMLELYDTPTAELNISYALYEIDGENDGRVGADFQAWKNGDGSRAMSLGGRYRNGWNTSWDAGISKTNSSDASFVNLSPKWNTRYLDFLMSRGQAKVVTHGQLTVMNSTTGIVNKTINLFGFEDGAAITDGEITNEYMIFNTENFVPFDQVVLAADDLRILAFDTNGSRVDFGTNFTGNVAMARISEGNQLSYYLKILRANVSADFEKDGKGLGRTARCFALTVQRWDGAAWNDVADWVTDNSIAVPRDVERDVNALANISGVTNQVGYGFRMELSPTVAASSTQLRILMQNDSLVGFADDGTPRITAASVVDTQVMLSNSGKTFFIGGLEKKTLVKSVTKVPYLGDIPVLGWAFSSESESTKNAQLVLVMNCAPVVPEQSVPEGMQADIMKVKAATRNSGGEYNYENYGFDQYLIDDTKKGIDPLP